MTTAIKGQYKLNYIQGLKQKNVKIWLIKKSWY